MGGFWDIYLQVTETVKFYSSTIWEIWVKWQTWVITPLSSRTAPFHSAVPARKAGQEMNR